MGRRHCCSRLTQLPLVVFTSQHPSFISGEDADWASKLPPLLLGPITFAGWMRYQDGPGLTHMPTSGPGSCAEFQKGIANTCWTGKKQKVRVVHLQGQESLPRAEGTCRRAHQRQQRSRCSEFASTTVLGLGEISS